MKFFGKTQTHQKQASISASEAHRVWEKTRFRYLIVNNIIFYANYVHDIDFKYKLYKLKDSYLEEAKKLEKELKNYALKSPEPNLSNIEVPNNSELISDKEIARTIQSLIQLAVLKCVKVLDDAILNDDLRQVLLKITKDEINKYYDFVEYTKNKGWIENPPFYPHVKGNYIVTANEVWELWNHLNYRYLHVHQTKVFRAHVADKDFQLLLSKGMNILAEQIKKLENKLLEFGINLPAKHPLNFPEPESKQNYDDKTTYALLFNSMKNATVLHGYALHEIIMNDKVMKLFRDLFFIELTLVDDLIRYGKIKGWVPLIPSYRE
ncbi:DUF3231 family protein [Natronospora cellulosivora (SeqCode)]